MAIKRNTSSKSVKMWWQKMSLQAETLENQRGFSLIELLLVVVIIGIVAAMAIPAFQKGIWAAENGRAFGNMRTIGSTQVSFFSQNGRFGRLDELNRVLGGSLGTVAGDRLVWGKYVFEMSPQIPTNDELRTEYTIIATRTVPGELTYSFEITQTGEIMQIAP